MKNENVNVEEVTAAPAKAKKGEVKKDNFFKRMWKKLVKLCKDTAGEMKKVVWTSKSELWKNTKLVLFAVVAIGAIHTLTVYVIPSAHHRWERYESFALDYKNVTNLFVVLVVCHQHVRRATFCLFV